MLEKDDLITTKALAQMKLADIVKTDKYKKNVSILVYILAIIGVVCAVGAIVYGIYKHLNPEYADDMEDFYPDWEDDGFEDEKDPE